MTQPHSTSGCPGGSGRCSGPGRLKFFLALSRTPHGLLDMAAPVLTALLWLGRFPPPGIMLLGVFTAFAAYTAVYAVNDLADYATDKANYGGGTVDTTGYLDAVFVRHPLAQGKLGLGQGLAWATAWGLAAALGAWALNPVCAWLLLMGAGLEVVYCKLLKVSHLRALINGVVKTLGGVAAVLAVDPNAGGLFLLVVFAMLFLWEIGGQNIPADWFDLELDRRQGARTMPVSLGTPRAARLAFWCLGGAALLGVALLALSPAGLPWRMIALGAALNIWLLALPAWRLSREQSRARASSLFNRASYFPAGMLAITLLWFALR